MKKLCETKDCPNPATHGYVNDHAVSCERHMTLDMVPLTKRRFRIKEHRNSYHDPISNICYIQPKMPSHNELESRSKDPNR